ncbi:MAG: hypothetical protein EP344_05690 [Bacteroidetes bacterium]|nr:MAG: hypothetical protein EP344_05690 [Bacteroidota bacterium]
MNKKLILAGLVVCAGFTLLTAFGSGKTLEQQKQEIAAAITAQLDEFRAQKQEECTLRVNEEAQRRFDEYLAEQANAKPASSRSTRRTTTKPAATKDPLPQTAPTDPQKTRSGAAQEGNVEEQKTRSGAIPVTSDTKQSAEQQKKRGGATKKEGGN